MFVYWVSDSNIEGQQGIPAMKEKKREEYMYVVEKRRERELVTHQENSVTHFIQSAGNDRQGALRESSVGGLDTEPLWLFERRCSLFPELNEDSPRTFFTALLTPDSLLPLPSRISPCSLALALALRPVLTAGCFGLLITGTSFVGVGFGGHSPFVFHPWTRARVI